MGAFLFPTKAKKNLFSTLFVRKKEANITGIEFQA